MPSKGKRLKDVLDEKFKDISWITDKLLHLKARIESHNPRLDEDGGDDIRWVERVIMEIEEGELMPYEQELKRANKLWKKWK